MKIQQLDRTLPPTATQIKKLLGVDAFSHLVMSLPNHGLVDGLLENEFSNSWGGFSNTDSWHS
jgi:hypothetical protein